MHEILPCLFIILLLVHWHLMICFILRRIIFYMIKFYEREQLIKNVAMMGKNNNLDSWVIKGSSFMPDNQESGFNSGEWQCFSFAVSAADQLCDQSSFLPIGKWGLCLFVITNLNSLDKSLLRVAISWKEQRIGVRQYSIVTADSVTRVWSPARTKYFFYPLRPDRLCGPTSLISNGYRGLRPLG